PVPVATTCATRRTSRRCCPCASSTACWRSSTTPARRASATPHTRRSSGSRRFRRCCRTTAPTCRSPACTATTSRTRPGLADQAVAWQYARMAAQQQVAAQVAPRLVMDANLSGYFGGNDGGWSATVQHFLDVVKPRVFSFDRYPLLMNDGYHNTPAQEALWE